MDSGDLIAKLPTETIEQLMLQMDINSIMRLCELSRHIKAVFVSNRMTRRLIDKFELGPGNLVFAFISYDATPLAKLRAYYHLFNQTEITCTGKKVRAIPYLPFVQILHCEANHLASLPRGLESLRELYCDSNPLLATLPEDLDLHVLSCVGNSMKLLPFRMDHLKVLHCDRNQLLELPDMPQLMELNCDDNYLTALPQLQSIVTLNCNRNRLVNLPRMSSLVSLTCFSNLLESLPNGMSSLVKLNCSTNKLRTLPRGMVNLEYLNCDRNPLTYLPSDLRKLKLVTPKHIKQRS